MKVTLADDPAPGNDAGEDERTRVFFRTVGVFDTLSRDRPGGLSRDAVARLKTLDSGDEEIARRR